MSDPKSIRKELTAIRNQALQQNPQLPGEILVSWPIAIAQRSDDPTARVTTYHSLSNSKSCRQHDALEVSGVSATDQSGKVVLKLSDFYCVGGSGVDFGYPVALLATARGGSTYITAKPEITPDLSDIEMSFESFGGNGAAVGGVRFSWHCIAALDDVVS